MQAEAQKASLEVSPLNNDGNVSIKVCGELDTRYEASRQEGALESAPI